MRTERDLFANRTDESGRTGSRTLAQIIGMAAIMLLAGNPAFGQFLVQPMRIQAPVEPARRFAYEIVLENLSTVATETISLSLMDLTQDPNGIWRELRPDDPNVERLGLRSCVSWLSLEKDVVEVTPFGRVPLKLFIKTPSGRRGYYFAAVLAQSAPRTEVVEGMTTMTILQYVIPVILEVSGRPMRHEVDLTDVGLEFQSQTATRPAATMVAMDIENAGGTYSRLQGFARVFGEWGGHWTKIMQVQFPETGIIPGVKLHLRQDVGRPLPSGKYRVEGYLYVDAQRSGRVEKELEFKGDPRVVAVRGDVPLDLSPREVFIETLPGAIRGDSLTVANASEEGVTVTAELVLPEHMAQIVNARGVPGEAYGCVDWLTVEPRQFTLRGYGRQNLKIVARMPDSAVQFPNYYAMIRLHATYADGEGGGMTKARVCVQNRKATGLTRIDNMMLTVSELSAGRYLATARFLNNGDTHVQPRCRAVLTTVGTSPDDQVRKRFIMSSEEYEQTGILLPLDTRNFSGVLDVTDVSPGTYRLTAILEHDQGGAVQGQRGIQVVEEGGQKVVRLLGPDRVSKTVINL